MSTLLEQPVEISRMLIATPGEARAIEDPARTKMLEMLYHRTMTAEQMAAGLKKSGHEKALTTVRHHIKVLRESGLIQLTKIEEVRGTISKHYGTQTRLLNYTAPEDFDSKYSKVIDTTTTKVERLLQSINTRIPRPKNDKQPEAYYHYLAAEILNRAITNSLEPAKE